MANVARFPANETGFQQRDFSFSIGSMDESELDRPRVVSWLARVLRLEDPKFLAVTPQSFGVVTWDVDRDAGGMCMNVMVHFALKGEDNVSAAHVSGQEGQQTQA